MYYIGWITTDEIMITISGHFLLFMMFFSNNIFINMIPDQQIEAFKIIGIEVRTTNENEQSQTDLGDLWDRFYSENITKSYTRTGFYSRSSHNYGNPC